MRSLLTKIGCDFFSALSEVKCLMNAEFGKLVLEDRFRMIEGTYEVRVVGQPNDIPFWSLSRSLCLDVLTIRTAAGS